MLFLALIVSALPWFPTPFSVWGLIALGLMAFLSQARWLGWLVLLLLLQELRLQSDVDRLWPEAHRPAHCDGQVVIDRVITRTPEFSSVSARWHEGDCADLDVGDGLKVTIERAPEMRPGDQLAGSFRLKPIVAMVNTGGFDARRHALASGWRGQASIRQPTVLSETSLRLSAQARVDQWPQPLKGLLLALLFGEKDQLDDTMQSVFAGLGLSHILAISGLHVGVVLALCWWGFARSPWPTDPRARVILRAIVVSIAAWTVAYWTLWSDSVVRAALMATLFSLLPLVDRPLRLGAVLGLTLCGVLLLEPTATLSTGLLMSGGAVGLIALLFWANPSQPIASLIRMQLGFSLILASVLSLFLGFVYPWLGLLANLLFVPFLPIVLVILFGSLLWPVEALIDVFNTGLMACIHLLDTLVQHTLFSAIPSDSVLWLLLSLGLLLCIPWPVSRMACGIGMVALVTTWGSKEPVQLTVHDIGQGSAATLQVGTHTLIMDLAAGQADRWSRVDQFYPSVTDPSALQISVSHADLDHSGGLSDVLNQSPIPLSIEGGGSLPGLMRTCQSKTLGTVRIEVLWPSKTFLDSENHQSCVLLIESEARRVLMLGDADWLAEAWVIRQLSDRNLLGRIDAVVVSHHGAEDGSSPSFVRFVGAKDALISVGRHNRYGHPHSEVLARWQASGASIFRTDLDGALTYDFSSGSTTPLRQRAPTRWNLWSDDHR